MSASASGANNGTSWANAYTDLQSALGTSPCTEVWVKSGTYKPTTGTNRSATFQLKNGVALYGGFAGTETALTQRNPTVNVTILSGDIDNNDSQTPIITDTTTVTGSATNSYHVITGATGATLDGFTITAGNANAGRNNQYEGSGGGMYNRLSSPTVTNVTFIGNQATAYGSGMVNFGSSPRVTNSTFRGNWAGYGGGMFNYSSSNPTLTNVTFSGNSAMDDCGVGSACGCSGGVGNYSSSPTLTNVTFSGNQALSCGGGMGNSASRPTLTNVTFAGNQALFSGSGGIANWNSSSPTIRNTIFWGNTGQIYNSDIASSPVVSYSVVQGGYASGTNIITADPLLGSLSDYGGSTKTIPLQAGSSAIDTGNNAVCPATDQRGYMRPVDGDGNGSAICDIGAYEAGAVPLPTITSTTVTSSPNPSTVGQQVTFTATVSGSGGTPTGTVAFKDAGTTITSCSTQPLDGSGQATCVTSSLAAGAHPITAEYSGDANFNASTGTLTGGQTVNPATSSNDVFLPMIIK